MTETYVIDGTLTTHNNLNSFELDLMLPVSGLIIKGVSKDLIIENKVDLPKMHGIYILEGDGQYYVGQSKNLQSRIKNHKGNNKIDFNRCFLLLRDNDWRQYLDYLEAFTIQKMENLGYILDNYKKPNPDEDVLSKQKKEIAQKWVNEFLLFLPILGLNKTTNKILDIKKETYIKKNATVLEKFKINLNEKTIIGLNNKSTFIEMIKEIGIEKILNNCSHIFTTEFHIKTEYKKPQYGTCNKIFENQFEYFIYINASSKTLPSKIEKISKILNLNTKVFYEK